MAKYRKRFKIVILVITLLLQESYIAYILKDRWKR